MGETEITAEVFEPIDKIKSKLVKNGFKLIENYIISDYYFSKYPMSRLVRMSYKSLIKSSILIREISKSEKKCYAIFKDKAYDRRGNVISERKIKAPLADLKLVEILKSSGLTNWESIINKSYIYKNAEFEFALQVVDGLGIFIEIEEDEPMKNLSASEKIRRLRARAQSLGLRLGDDYSCKKVYMKFLKENNIQNNC